MAILPVSSGVAADLVSAINTANTNGDASNTIQLSGTYDLTAVDNYWYGPDGLPAITSNLTIAGDPTNGATIERSSLEGTPNFRLFFVSGGQSGLTPGNLTLHDVTLANGLAQGGASGFGGGGLGAGGAIFSMGTVKLDGVTVTGNRAIGGAANSGSTSSGGGIGEDPAGVQSSGGGFGGTTPGASGGIGAAGSGSSGGGGGGFNAADSGSSNGTGGGSGQLSGGGGDGGQGGTDSTAGGATGGDFDQGGAYGGGGNGGGGGIGGGGGGSQSKMGGGGGFGGGGGVGSSGGGPGGFGGGGGGAGSNSGGSGGFGGGAGATQPGSSGGGGAGLGGAVFNFTGDLSIVNSTLAGNTATGGSANYGNGGSGYGGGIFNLNGSVSLVNSTLNLNSTVAGLNGSKGSNGLVNGGDVYNLAYGREWRSGGSFTQGGPVSATVTLANSILLSGSGAVSSLVNNLDSSSNSGSGNSAIANELQNTGSAATSIVQGYNNNESLSTLNGGASDNSTSLITLAGSLAGNGGPTQTIALTASSAFATFAPGASPAPGLVIPGLDQRGLPRSSSAPSVGAFELLPPGPLGVFTSSNNITASGAAGTTTTVVVTYGESGSGTIDTSTFGTGNITVDHGATVTGYSAAGNVVTYTITAPGSNWGTSYQGAYTIGLVAGNVQDTSSVGIPGNASLGTFNVDVSQLAPTTTTLTSSAGSSANNQPVTFTATVAGAQGPGTPSGTVTFKDGSTTLGTGTVGPGGIATYSTSSLSVGPHTITAVYGGDVTFAVSTSPAVTQTVVAHAAASHFTVTGGAPDTAGGTQTYTVTALDPYGNTDTGYSGTVHFTSSDPQAVLPADATLTNGAGSFAVTLETAGSNSVTATDTMTPAITGTEAGILITPGVESHFSVTGLVGGIAGTPGTATVTALDAFGNVATGYTGSVHFTSDDPQAILPADGTLIGGVGTFLVTLETAGCESVTVNDTAFTKEAGTQSGIPVTAAPASHFAVTGAAGGTAGANESVTVTALDPYGNVTTDYGGTVTISSSDGLAVLPADATLTNGVGTFFVTLKTAGSDSITATDIGNPNLTGVEAGIVVTAGNPDHFAVTGGVDGVAGVVEAITVTAYDPYGNLTVGYGGTVTISSSDGLAVLPPDAMLVNGVGTFNVTLRTAGTQSITATDTINNDMSGVGVGIGVSAGAATHFAVTGGQAGAAGSVEVITVSALDPFGNVAVAYPGTVHLTSSDGQAVLPADSTLTNGVGTFDVTLKTAGTNSVTATDTGNPSLSGVEVGIIITAGVATHLAVTGGVNGTAAVVEAMTVTALDAYGNVATGDTGTVHLTSTDPQATLPADAPLVNGAVTFNVTLKTAGSQTITATDTVTAVTGSESGVLVAPAAASHLAVTGLAGGTAGSPGTVTVTALDPYGNVATGDTGTVHLTSSDGQAALPANAALVNGVVIFNNVTLKTAGPQTITATDTVTAATGTESGILITPAAASHLAVTGLAGGTAGSPGTVTVTALDPYGNVATGDTGTVHLTSNDPQAALPADAALVNGVATFAITLKTAGTNSVTATDITTAAAGSESGIVITPAAASRWVVTAQPPGSVAVGTGFGLTVASKDAFGNVNPEYNGPVTVTLVGPGTLGGTLTVVAVNGLATFAGLTLDTLATGDVLHLAGGSLASATSASFDVTPALVTVSGTVFLDLDAAGTIAGRDPGLAGRVVFVDLHGDGVLHPDDPRATTDASGDFTIAGVTPGTALIRVKAFPGDSPTGPNGGLLTLNMASGTNATGANFGLQPGSVVVPRTPTPLAFAGGATTAAGIVEGLYRTILGRQGEPAGIDHWVAKMAAGEANSQVAEEFLHSPEYRGDTIESYYETYLGRHSDAAGMSSWLAAFGAGWTESQVAEYFLSSPEYDAAHADPADYVGSLYANTLGRDAVGSEVAYWTGRLTGGATRGMVAAGVVESTEAYLRGIEGDYTALLARVGEAPGINTWLAAIQAGTTTLAGVEASFFDTPELIARAAPG